MSVLCAFISKNTLHNITDIFITSHAYYCVTQLFVRYTHELLYLHLYTLHLQNPSLHIYISTFLHTCLPLALYLTLHFTSLMTIYAYMHINIDQQTRLQIYFV